MKTLQDLLFSLPFTTVYPLTKIGETPVSYDRLSFDPYSETEAQEMIVYLPFRRPGRDALTEDDMLQLMQMAAVKAVLIYHPEPLPAEEGYQDVYELFEVPVVRLGVPLTEDPAVGAANPNFRLLQDTEQATAALLYERIDALQTATGQPVTLLDETFKVIKGPESDAPDLHGTWAQHLIQSRSRWLQRYYFHPESFVREAAGQTIPLSCFPVYVQEEVKGFVITPLTHTPWYRQLFDYYALLLSLVMQEERKMEEVNGTFKHHFLHDLLYNNFKHEQALRDQARTWGWQLEGPHHLAVIRIQANPEHEQHLPTGWHRETGEALIRRIRQDLKEAIIEWFQGDIILIQEAICAKDGNVRRDRIKTYLHDLLVEAAKKDEQLLAEAGIGKCYPSPTALNKSYQEALMALKLGHEWSKENVVYHIEDLGVLRLLFYLNQDHLTEFSESYLAPLIQADSQGQTAYIHTLKMWIIHDMNVQETAAALHVHPNTLRNRMQKISSLLHVDLYNHEDFVNISIAVKIHTIDFLQTTVKNT
ncbi:PucR family transcriptional regulator [Salisediminibacterium selenitireducens]|uniref:Transcriptional regulator, CdaR n=1 Tax=Bacillus selenitireducens (strain ATCC 700615 / DSM 15326 / MLS10) TaxID=439292 RepID=D6Y0L7_BACIE|nr:helix-turn-helix domain-containing protein [Salisediminibacterium selenitireducens]ADI00585.1 transcriptional regulator, CdaR [[Bacillus] selenitireducens MLS10]